MIENYASSGIIGKVHTKLSAIAKNPSCDEYRIMESLSNVVEEPSSNNGTATCFANLLWGAYISGF